jgi:hypothetical protein
MGSLRAMPKSPFLALTLLGTALGCSSSSGNNTSDSGPSHTDSGAADQEAHHDAGHDTGQDTDTGESDSGSDTGFDAGPPPTPTGTTLDKGPDMAIQGVTDDGYVIYRTATAVKAVSLSSLPDAGGTPMVVVSLGDAGAGSVFAVVVHKDVFVWSTPNGSFVATLTLWSHSLGTPTQLSAASIPGLASASADSSAIVFTSAAASSGATASLVGATTSALGSPATLATNLDVSGQICRTNISFTGTASPFTAVASFCIVGDGGTEGPDNVYAYSSTAWTGNTPALATGITAFSLDTTGTSAAISLASGQLEIAPLSGAAVVPIDVAGTLGMTSTAYLSKTDAFVLYNTGAGALRTSPITTSTPQTLAASMVNGMDGVSSSEAWVLVHNNTDMSTGLPSDLSLASTSAAGTPAPLTSGTTVAGVLGDAFSADSSYAIYMTGITLDAKANAVGALKANSVATPGTVVQLATAAVNDTNFSPSDRALTGTTIVFTDNFNPSSGVAGSVDLHVVDLASATPSTIVMAGADPGFAVSFDKKFIIYTITFGGSTDGLYAVAQ